MTCSSITPSQDAGLQSLAVYGSLAPGQFNHHVIASLRGTWHRGFVRGHLRQAGWGSEVGFPGIDLDPAGPAVPVEILVSPDLPGAWDWLDAFEGPEYQRTAVTIEDGASQVMTTSQIYSLRAR